MKRIRMRILAQLYLIFVCLVLAGIYLGITNFHVHKGLPEHGSGQAVELEYLDGKLYFIDNKIFSNLRSASLDGLSMSESLGINGVREIAKSGQFIFAICQEERGYYPDTVYIYDTKKDQKVEKINLKEIPIGARSYCGFFFACADDGGIWMESVGNATLFLQITATGNIKVVDVKEYSYARLLQHQNGKLFFSSSNEDGKTPGIYAMDEETGKVTKLSDRTASFGFLWNEQLLLGQSMVNYDVGCIDLNEGEERTLPFNIDGEFCIYKDMLYGTDGNKLCAYDLSENKSYCVPSNEWGLYDGAVVADDGKLFLARETLSLIGKTKIFYEDLNKIKWKENTDIEIK